MKDTKPWLMKAISNTCEMFSSGNKYYFLDFRKAVNNTHYIRITRSDDIKLLNFKLALAIVFEEDFVLFIKAFLLFSRYARFKLIGDDQSRFLSFFLSYFIVRLLTGPERLENR